MSRPRNTIPKLCKNAKGYLFSRNPDGSQVWFGHESNPESTERYSTWLVAVRRGESVEISTKTPAKLQRATINELCLRFITEYCPRYRTSSGKQSAELRCFAGVVKLLRGHFGGLVADDFGAVRLRLLRDAMVESGWSRKFINKQVCRLRLLFRIGVSWEMVRPEVLTMLDSVPPLVAGETSAPERKPRRAVPQSSIDAVRKRIKQRNRDILDLLLLTGCRPGELLSLRPADIDQTGEIWRAELQLHKTSHHDKERVILFNAKAQEILRPYLAALKPTERMFPILVDTFSDTIKSACKRAGVCAFVPHQLRHTVATRLADEVGTEAAQRLLGHSTRAMTEHYSRAAEKTATEAVKRLG